MKTPYESRTKFGIDRLIFGKVKKRSRKVYIILIAFYILMCIVFF